MARTIHGRVHGKTIELDEDPGVAEGQEVQVQVTLIFRSHRQPGDRLDQEVSRPTPQGRPIRQNTPAALIAFLPALTTRPSSVDRQNLAA